MGFLERQFIIAEARNCPLYRQGERFSLSGISFFPPARKPACLLLVRTLSSILLDDTEVDSAAKAKGRSYNCTGCTGIIKFTSTGQRQFFTQHMQMVAAAEQRKKLERFGSLVGMLAKFSFFRALDEQSLKDIIACAVMRTFPAGATILRRNQPGKYLFIIIDGQVVCENAEGQPIAYLGPGELFGEMSLLTGQPVSATVKAVQPLKTLTIAAEDLRDILVRYPFLQAAFIRLLVQRLAALNRAVPPSTGMMGNIGVVSCAELLQMFHENLKTGKITFTLPDGTATVLFVDGEIVAADYGELHGVAAFNAILKARQGSFSFTGDIDPAMCERPPVGGFMKLLMDGLRLIDEEGG